MAYRLQANLSFGFCNSLINTFRQVFNNSWLDVNVLSVAESSKDQPVTSDYSVFLSSYGNTQISAAPELWRLCEGGTYLRVVLIRGWHLFEGGAYSRATLINFSTPCVALNRGWGLFRGGAYSSKYGIPLWWVSGISEGGGSLSGQHFWRRKSEAKLHCKISRGENSRFIIE